MLISTFYHSLNHLTSSNNLLGIDEDDEHEEENEEGVSLLKVAVPECLGDVRKAVAGEQAAHLAEHRREAGQLQRVIVTEQHMSRVGNKYPVDGIGVWCDLFSV